MRISDQQIYDAIRRYEGSDQRNRDCVYTDQDGRHCFAGQILSDLGYPIPGWRGSRNAEIVESLPDIDDWLSGTAIGVLSDMQNRADNEREGLLATGDRITWGQVISYYNDQIESLIH